MSVIQNSKFMKAYEIIDDITKEYDFDMDLNLYDEIASDILELIEKRVSDEFENYKKGKALYLEDRMMKLISEELNIPIKILKKRSKPRNQTETDVINLLDYICIKELLEPTSCENTEEIIRQVEAKLKRSKRLRSLADRICESIGIISRYESLTCFVDRCQS